MATKPATAKRLPKTVKEKKFAKEYIENGGNAVQAALKVYDVQSSKDPYNTAGTIASENMQKLTFDHYFRSAGLTDEVIAQAITVKALTAKKRDQFSGEVTDDHTEQRHNLELAVKIMGKFAAQRAPVDEEGRTVVPIISFTAE